MNPSIVLKFSLLFLAALCSLARGQEAESRKAEAPNSETQYGRGPHAVESVLLEWHDKTRDRDVPVKIYSPKDVAKPAPVIVFSHGLGGSRNGYSYLGEQWASRGYVSVHLQHPGSDDSLIRGKGGNNDRSGVRGLLEKAGTDPSAAINRPKDVTFAIDQLEALNAGEGQFAKKLDIKRLGMAGHSFGAWTTMAIVGQKVVLPAGLTFGQADPRIKAAIAMSSPTPNHGGDPQKAYAAVTIPVFHMTGTLDDMPIGNSPAIDRRIPYDLTAASDQYLLIFKGGDHMVFSGRMNRAGNVPLNLKGMTGDGKLDPQFQTVIKEATTAFWDAYLNADANAKSWLTTGSLEERLGELGTYEHK